MSGRTVSRQDRAKACWHEEKAWHGAKERSLVTAARREAMRQLALDDPAKFVRCLHLSQFVSLAQLPWWPAFAAAYPWEAAEVVLLAREVGIGIR